MPDIFLSRGQTLWFPFDGRRVKGAVARVEREVEEVIYKSDLASAMIEVRRNPWAWMAVAFGASLALASTVIVVFGAHRGVYVALAATARLAFLIFWPAYAGGALASLFGASFRLCEGTRATWAWRSPRRCPFTLGSWPACAWRDIRLARRRS